MKDICMFMYNFIKYFFKNNSSNSFLINHWFGPSLEQYISVPVIDRNQGLLRL